MLSLIQYTSKPDDVWGAVIKADLHRLAKCSDIERNKYFFLNFFVSLTNDQSIKCLRLYDIWYDGVSLCTHLHEL